MLNLWFFYINIIKWNIWLFKIICNIIRTKMINLRLLWIICNNLISQNSCMNFFWTCFAFFLLLCNIFSFCISWFIKKLWDIALAYAVTDLMRIIEVNVSLFPLTLILSEGNRLTRLDLSEFHYFLHLRRIIHLQYQ